MPDVSSSSSNSNIAIDHSVQPLPLKESTEVTALKEQNEKVTTVFHESTLSINTSTNTETTPSAVIHISEKHTVSPINTVSDIVETDTTATASSNQTQDTTAVQDQSQKVAVVFHESIPSINTSTIPIASEASTPTKTEDTSEKQSLEKERLEALAKQDEQGCTALTRAIGTGSTYYIPKLLDGLSSSARLAALDQPDKTGCTPLIAATFKNNVRAIKELLKGLSPKEQQFALARRGHGPWSHQTPLDLCLSATEEETLVLLTSLNARSSIDPQPLTEYETERLLYSRFGLKDAFEGTIPSPIIYQSLSDSLRDFIRTRVPREDQIDNQSLTEIEEAFSKTNAYRLMPARAVAERILAGESVVIPTGWPKHETAVVFSNGLVMKCNRGDRSSWDKDIGFSIFEPSVPLNLDRLTFAIEFLRKREHDSHYYNSIDTALRLKKVLVSNDDEMLLATKSAQKVGNCMFASAKTAFAALLFAKFRHSEKFGTTHVLYKKFKAFDLKTNLLKNRSWARAHPEAVKKASRAMRWL
jgi:hypothetical protein